MPAQYTSIELIPTIVANLRKEFNTGKKKKEKEILYNFWHITSELTIIV